MDNDPRRRPGEDWPSTSDPQNRLRHWEDVSLLERTPRVVYYVVGAFILLMVAIGVLLPFGILPGDNANLRFKVRAPTNTPEWLIPTSGAAPVRNLDASLYASQTWCTVLEARSLSVETVRTRVAEQNNDVNRVDLICVQYWQSPYTLQIEPDRKTEVTVDGTQGWLWRLSKDDFWNESRIIINGGDAAVLRPALAEEFASNEDAFKRAGMYFKIRDARLLNTATLSGPAIMLQWNKDGQHFVLIGESQRPVTEDLLLDMANSLVRAEQLEATATAGQ